MAQGSKSESEPNLIDKPKRKRRTKAEIVADRAREEEARANKTAESVREEMKLGKSLKAKVASVVMAAIGDNWSQIERDGRMADIQVSIYQPSDDLNTVKVRLTFKPVIVTEKSVIIDDGNRDLPLGD